MGRRFDQQAVAKNIYSEHEKLRREVDTLQRRQINPLALEMPLTWGDDVETAGPGNDHNTTSTFNAQIMPLFVRYPTRILGIMWSVRNAGTYEIRYLWEANIASSFETLYSAAAAGGAGGPYGFAPDIPIILMPGMHYFGCYTTPAVTWWDYNASGYCSADKAWAMAGIYYNTNKYDYTAPVTLTYQVGTWA